jgi:hypothetical protein
MSDNSLGNFLKDLANFSWEEFVRAEKSKDYTTNESIVFALVRACAMQKLDAIKISLNRLDGKLKTPIKVEYPKVYYLFPNAVQKPVESGDKSDTLTLPHDPKPADPKADTYALTGEVLPPKPEPTIEVDEHDIEKMGLRETLRKMAEYQRDLPGAIIELQAQTELYVRGQGPRPREIPRVKSVVAAHLLEMAQKRNMDAIYEVFDQIDGKLVETLQILGEDIYLTSYATEAPPTAKLNADGVLQVEAEAVQLLWAQKLSERIKE